jgi:hypothetical protein
MLEVETGQPAGHAPSADDRGTPLQLGDEVIVLAAQPMYRVQYPPTASKVVRSTRIPPQWNGNARQGVASTSVLVSTRAEP